MTSPFEPLATCPDCGGLLQPIEPERLITTEFDADRTDDPDASPSQCLICGYQRPAAASSIA
ncbi:MAG TPA: hypothetical protein VNK41_09750 [Vicinamibacterales bacterium]|nr:hypothetical protein [Vicinamibacterales bacterium]